jgi:antitoxin StbD
MDQILTMKATSISDFKQNPNREVKLAGDEPFAVLTNNKPSFYVLSPKLYDELLEKLWELEVTPTILARLQNSKPLKVNIKDLLSGKPVPLEESDENA